MTDTSTIRLTTSQAIVRYLVAQHSERDGKVTRLIPGFVGIFGHGNTGGFGQALDEYRKDAFFIEGRNEQGMTHIAAAYAKAMRRDATLACTASVGPGSTNMLTAAAGAYINRLPLLLLPADEYATRRPGTILQGLENPSGADLSVNDCFRPVSRYFDRISRPEQLLDSLPKAVRTLIDPVETGPAVLAVPQDVQVEAYDFPLYFFEPRNWRIARPRPDRESLQPAIDAILAAQRPVIVAGGGVLYSRAEAEMLRFAQAAGIPIVETMGGKGAVTEASPLALGGLGVAGTPVANDAAGQADLVVCLGTRLSDFVTGAQSVFQNPDVRFIGVNVNSADAVKYGGMPVVGDLRETLVALLEILPSDAAADRRDYLDEISTRSEAWLETRAAAFSPEDAPPLRQTELIGSLNNVLEPEDTLVTSAGTLPGDAFRYWDATEGPECHIEFGYSCMGYDIAGAIGVRLAQSEGHVFALLGDATFLLSPSDLAVAVQHGSKITVVVSDNQGMQSIVGLESRMVGHPFANIFEYRDPVSYELGDAISFDIAKIGDGLGAHVISVSTRDELEQALRTVRDLDGPSFIVVKTDVGRAPAVEGAWWDIGPATVSADGSVDALRETFERGLRTQRFHY